MIVRKSAVAIALMLLVQTVASGQVAAKPEKKVQNTSVSKAELNRLRPTVLADLKPALRRVFGDNPGTADLERAFLECEFQPLRLGSIGRAIVVEYKGTGGPNVPMINIYVPSGKSFRRVVQGAGFGPQIYSGPGSVPYVVFGGAEGVCTARLFRYGYRNHRYEVSACDQEVAGGDGECQVKACGSKLPTFPDPFATADTQQPDRSSAYYLGPGRTGHEILQAKTPAGGN